MLVKYDGRIILASGASMVWSSRIKRATNVLVLGVGLSAVEAAAQISRIAVGADGSIFVAADGRAIIRIDPQTGASRIVSSDAVGRGPTPFVPWGISVEPDATLLVTERASGSPRVVRVDPLVGDRTIVSDAATGTGPILEDPFSIVVAAGGAAFVGDTLVQSGPGRRILSLQSSTGDRATVSDATTGTGPNALPFDIAVEWDGNLVATTDGNAVMRVDAATGDRVIVSDKKTGGGPRFSGTSGIAVQPDSSLLVTNLSAVTYNLCYGVIDVVLWCLERAPSVMRVDPVSGRRAVLSGGGWALFFGTRYLEFQRVTPYFGRKGRGPGFGYPGPSVIAVETGDSFVVGAGSKIVRVQTATGQRKVLADITPLLSATQDPVASSHAVDPGRMAFGHPAHEAGWRRPEDAERRLQTSEAQREVIGERLYVAVWKAVRDARGVDDPDVQDAAPQPFTAPAVRPATK